ncbi:NAD-dependent epimerase/dehydratase family protein [Candidatus Saccharibacteria bacterium]|nr:NAD-dependent epimerase/dehydratase family protein [Candidatus Saccharibacteria bacterium]
MPSVLVTGVNGFVGPYVSRELDKNGIEVHGIAGPHNCHTNTDFASYQVVDLLEPDAVSEIDMTRIDSVIHLAGMVSVTDSFRNPDAYKSANHLMQANLLNAANKQDASPRFVIASSGGVYDGSTSRPSEETSDVNPLSPYTSSKIDQETTMQEYARKYGFSYAIVRGFNHIGPGMRQDFLVGSLARQLARSINDDAPSLTVGNLNPSRDYVDVRDVAIAYRLLSGVEAPDGIYNVCSGRSLSGKEVLSKLIDIACIQPIVKIDPDLIRSADTELSVGSFKKINAVTAWSPSIPIEVTLRDVFEYEKSKAATS